MNTNKQTDMLIPIYHQTSFGGGGGIEIRPKYWNDIEQNFLIFIKIKKKENKGEKPLDWMYRLVTWELVC